MPFEIGVTRLFAVINAEKTIYKDKTVVEITPEYFIFQYMLSVSLSYAWDLKLAKMSGVASWLKVQILL